MSDDNVDAEPLDGSCHRANRKAKIQRCPNCHAIELKRKGRNNYFRCPRCEFGWSSTSQPEYVTVRKEKDVAAAVRYLEKKLNELEEVHPEDEWDEGWNQAIAEIRAVIPDTFADLDVVDNSGDDDE